MFLSSLDPNFAERRLAILQELAEVGLHLVYKVAATPEPTGETVLAYQRAAKAIRQTLALELQIQEGRLPEAGKTAGGAPLVPQEPAEPRSARSVEGEGRLREVFELLEDAEPPADTDREQLNYDLDGWLEDLGDPEDFVDMPFEAIVERLCADLGLPADWGQCALQTYLTEALPYQQALRREMANGAPGSEIAANTS